MRWVSRVGSNPRVLLESLVPSPGEIRKLMLALRLAGTPALVVMDEPTKHMDLPSIECLESALVEYAGGLVLVSHDKRFLSALTTTAWHFEPERDSADTVALLIRRSGWQHPLNPGRVL